MSKKHVGIDSKSAAPGQGFSLIELIISSTILMLLILGTVQVLLYAIHLNSRVKVQAAATELVKNKLEYIKSLSFEAPELQPASWAETISPPNNPIRYHLEGKITNESISLKRIDIECYSTLHPQKRTRIVLLISQTLGF